MSKPSRLIRGSAGLAAIAAAFAADHAVTGSLQLHSENWAWHLARFLSRVGEWQYVLVPGLLLVAYFS